MALPDSSFKNIETGSHPFISPQWEDEFGRFCWIYARGFRDAMLAARQKAGVPADIHVTLIKAYTGGAPQVVPIQKTYKSEAPTLDWSKIATAQIDAAHETKPMRFDKVWLAIASLDQMCLAIDSGFDIWKTVRLCPSFFYLKGFDKGVVQKVKDAGKLDELKVFSHQSRDGIFNDMASGKNTVTFRTADLAAKWLKDNGFGTFAIERITKRHGWKPSSAEAVWHLDPANGPSRFERKELKALLK